MGRKISMSCKLFIKCIHLSCSPRSQSVPGLFLPISCKSFVFKKVHIYEFWCRNAVTVHLGWLFIFIWFTVPVLTSLTSTICFPMSLTPYLILPWIVFDHVLAVMVTDDGFIKLMPHKHPFMRPLKRNLRHHYLPHPLNCFQVLRKSMLYFLILPQRQFSMHPYILYC
jgi:hypothetical protein